MKKTKKIALAAIIISVTALLVGGIFWYGLGPKIDENNPPQIIEAHAIRPADVEGISKFRSGAGHDFSAGGETCRSMKHYFMPKGFAQYTATNQQGGDEYLPPAPTPETTIKIYSPLSGKITAIQSEQYPIGKQIYIRSDTHSNITVRLFHVYPLGSIKEGEKVTAGQQIGEISKYQQTDIAVQARSRNGEQFFSYFQMMPDALFIDYQKHGVQDRKALMISRAERDARPLQCNGEQFSQQNSPSSNNENWVTVQ